MKQIQTTSIPAVVILLVLFAAWIAGAKLEADSIRISFLHDVESLKDTEAVLIKNGCNRENIKFFEEAVRNYYCEPFDFNFAKFPKSKNGFYSFASAQELLAALPHHPAATQHSFDFNCMDLVIVACGNQLGTRLQPDDLFGPFMISMPTTNGEVLSLAATARDAFTIGYTPAYREATAAVIPASMQNSRICITACLYRLDLLPLSVTEQNFEPEVFRVLRANWQSESVRFPSRFEVVLVHGTDSGSRIIATSHAGLLLHRQNGYAYLEKAGGSGPFVRLDFANKDDLTPWLSAAFLKPPDDNSRRYATFNASSIKNLNLR